MDDIARKLRINRGRRLSIFHCIFAEFALCMKEGEGHDSSKVQNFVKMLQNHIIENYYHCTNEILAGLGQMYVADERFKNNIDKHADGTAAYTCKAIEVYCSKFLQ